MASVPADALDWEGRTVLDRAGEKIGRIEEIFLVEETGEPEWALVKLGRRKGRTTLVPLTRAHSVEKGVAVDVTKDVVSEAPAVTPDNELGEGEVVKLYRHYGLDLAAVSGAAEPASANGAPGVSQAAVQHHDSRPPEAAPEAVNGKADRRDEPI